MRPTQLKTIFALVAATSLSVPSTSIASSQKATTKTGDQFMSVTLQGAKVGYAKYSTSTVGGRTVSNSLTFIDTAMLGTALTMTISSTTVTANGKVVSIQTRTESAGRFQNLFATLGSGKIAVKVDNNGAKSTVSIPIPQGANIVDDPVTALLASSNRTKAKSFYVLDPTTVTLIKNDVKIVGSKTIEVKGKQVSTTQVDIIDPRMTSSAFVDSNNEVLLLTTALGFEMVPATKEEAMSLSKTSSDAKLPDFAEATRIDITPALDRPREVKKVSLELETPIQANLPTDEFQTAKKVEGKWIIDVHPQDLSKVKSKSIAAAGAERKRWTKPSLYIASGDKAIQKLAKQIIGKRTDVKSAALAIRKRVFEMMVPNAGIGVLRDATEVLKTKVGVCRDYAILSAALCRSVGIPTRVVSGIVSWDGPYYYHAWIEVWTGSTWLALDSIAPEDQISASHVKLNQGNVEEAFTFSVLSGSKLRLLAQSY